MKILTLQIKRPYLEEILSGKKKKEYREIRPKNANKYVIQNPDAENEEDWLKPVDYDAIRFFNGYASNRPEALVEVKDAFIELLTDEEGNDIVYEEDGQEYIEAVMVYTLGKVIERKNI